MYLQVLSNQSLHSLKDFEMFSYFRLGNSFGE